MRQIHKLSDYSSQKRKKKLLTNEKQYDDDVTIATLKQEISRLKLKKKKIEPERRGETLGRRQNGIDTNNESKHR